MGKELDRASAEAQHSANRARKPMAVFNLNRVGRPMYVVREADSFPGEDRMAAGPFEPQTGFHAEFPDFPPETLPAIPDGWRDGSWHNDSCPFFEISPAMGVFIDFEDPALSDFPEGRASGDLKRFTLVPMVDGCAPIDETPPLCASDDWTEILAHAIGRAFAAVLDEWLEPDEMGKVLERNKTVGEGVCASHDFCDANMAMDPAFTAVMRREIDLQSEEDCALWGKAWDIAKAAEFWQPTLADLTAEYQAWLTANNLPSMSADELECEVSAVLGGDESAFVAAPETEERREQLRGAVTWLKAFCKRWDGRAGTL